MVAHEQKAEQHVDSGKLVFREVCDEKVRRIESTVQGIKDYMREQFDEVKAMINTKNPKSSGR